MTLRRAAVALVVLLVACQDDSGSGSPGAPPDGAGDGAPISQDIVGIDAITPVDGTTGVEVATWDALDSGGPLDGQGPEPGTFGAPCDGNSDCLSGFCVEGPSGFMCTEQCVLDCPDGFDCKGVSTSGPDIVFLCVPRVRKLCVPCAKDSQCPEGACLIIGEQPMCAPTCEADGDCPAGYACSNDEAEKRPGKFCQPVTGTCDCTPDFEGSQRTCLVQSDLGACYGVESCDPVVGWVGCTAKTPEAETCNGADDDCDGLIDEGVPANEPCENTVEGVGACAGVTVCQGPLGLVCQAKVPAVEACDGADNDCDGATDEDFRAADGTWTLIDHCGGCANACADQFIHGTGACGGTPEAPQCVVASCETGYVKINDFQCTPPPAVPCQPCATDDECFGGSCLPVEGKAVCLMPCDGDGGCLPGYACGDAGGAQRCLPKNGTCSCNETTAGQKRSCQVGNEVGVCFGVETCDPGLGWTGCDAAAATPEVCDGVDNDCSNVADDGLPSGEPCENTVEGVGACPGVKVCQGEAGWVCQGATPEPEACDFKDNDCDGLVDEDFRDAEGAWTLDGHCGTCGNDCATKVQHGTGVCGGTPDYPVCVVASCDADYVKINAFQCALPPDVSCTPCIDDGGCFGGTCTTLDGQKVCLSACGKTGKSCAPGTACTAVGAEERCVPVTQSCACNEVNDGKTRGCKKQNANGFCYGEETCDAATGWTACSAQEPAEETCNGLDDDCDGSVDDGITPPAEPCEATGPAGTCTGQWYCADQGAGVQWWCSAAVPGAEICDYLDNDCDGVVDDGYVDPATGAYVGDADCGACGVGCAGAIPNATASCVQTAGKARCEVAACDPGYYAAGPLTCLPVGELLCAPCQTNANCQTPGDQCLPLDGGSFCGRDCGAGNLHGTPAGECPDGFTCSAIGGGSQCVPTSGSCTCLPGDEAKSRPCLSTNASGTCFGQELCDPALGWGACSAKTPAPEVCSGADDDCNQLVDDVPGRGEDCANTNAWGACPGAMDCAGGAAPTCVGKTPAAESCNHADDDCDGTVDEGFADLLQSCSAGVGACLRFGFRQCSADGATVVCTAEPGAPVAELCNGQDDDCDGAADEDFPDLLTTCTAGTGACQKVGFRQCTPDGAATACNAVAGTAIAETCNGLDDDCDGTADEDFADKGAVCTAGVGVCLATGTRICTADGGATVCSAVAGTAGVETCNGLDDDCDGAADEDFADKGSVCTAGTGACLATGTRVCAPDGSGTLCGAAAGTATAEKCNGLDDDCDGAIDEDYPDLLTGCTAGVGQCLKYGTVQCKADGSATECSTAAGAAAAETCNGLDDDCDGAVDEDFADKNTSCTVGAGACAAAGVRVCKADGSATQCNAVAGTATAEKCNGLDDDCDGATDEDFADKSTVCTVGVGVCAASGVRVCKADGTVTVCSATAGTATAEKCNGLDDDCDGATDEDFGDKGSVCTVGTGQCLASGVRVCTGDGSATQCSVSAGTATAEKCNGLDDDCDGAVDEDYPDLLTGCSAGVGACLKLGTVQCKADGSVTECSAAAGTATAEKCNGLDDDCDGLVDEDFADKNTACSAGVGACLASGVRVCKADGSATQCNAIAGAATAEKCNGLDDDCDGSVDEDFADKSTPCSVGAGVCAASGVRVCKADGSATQCNAVAGTATAEKCNGLDDDCDGSVDEDFADKNTPCSVGAGVCAASGVRVCKADGSATQCNAVAGTATAEKCNGLDDDCDGSVDEDFADKNTPCSVGAGVCAASGVRVCKADGTVTVCSAVAGTATAEKCNGLDDDCDGSVDEDFADKNTPCSTGTGACAATGVRVCKGDGTATQCNAAAGTPTAEKCNGVDDDCDGSVDEDFGDKGTVCTVGTGQCAASGVTLCKADGSGTQCNAVAGTPTTDTCNGLDDDCDGAVDEDYADKNTACTTGLGACLSSGVKVCKGDGSGTQCNAVAGTPTTDTCNGLDDDCDGSIDEDFADKNTACTTGVGACLSSGVKVCKGDGSGTQCNAVAGTAIAEKCNGLDDDCDGAVDEDFADKNTACTAGLGACLSSGVRVCKGDGSGTQCNAVAGASGVETCNGLDDDCDGAVDENLTAPACTKQAGVCAGSKQTCGGTSGWRACTGPEYGAFYEPTELTCDGKDNDCNGSTDTGLPQHPCANQAGVCAGALAACGGAAGWLACGAAQYGAAWQATESVCDGLDNDCDSQTDEGYKNPATGKYDSDGACGSCFTSCTAIFARPNAYGVCDASDAPTCKMVCCKVGTGGTCNGTTDWFDLNAVPDDGCEFLLDPNAIYVSATDTNADDVTGCGRGPVGTGALNRPCLSIAKGISEAVSTGRKKVLVADGLYTGTVTLVNGVSLLGGYRADTWERHLQTTLTTLRGVAGAGAHDQTVIATGITLATTLEGFTIEGVSSAKVGGNSYAVYVSASTASLVIKNNVILAGDGGPGADRAAAIPGPAGVDGIGRNSPGVLTSQYDGFVATGTGYCDATNNRQWANAGVRTCGGQDVSGGQGGGNRCTPSSTGGEYSGIDGVAGKVAAGGGAAGAAGDAGDDGRIDGSLCYLPGASMAGANGTNATGGAPGTGGSGCGSGGGAVAAGHWVPVGGANGGAGNHGGGAGGGGAGGGGYCFSCTEGKDRLGGHGGGGGSGGCGGAGALGGGGGGGSFGIFVTGGTAPSVSNNTILRGLGGRGGAGGTGGTGGSGGRGGEGGACPGSCFCFAAGGKGGEGGSGGHGGGGGGGCGGVSYGIYTAGVGSPTWCGAGAGNTISGGGGGTAGPGGLSLGQSGTVGSAGSLGTCSFN